MDSPPPPPPSTVTAGPKPVWPSHPEVGADFIGEVIDGRFQIIRRLAKGGMAHVFLAKDRTRKCQVAIKLLHRTGPGSRRRFESEAEVLSSLQHENIVRAIAFGHTEDGQPYMALEYLEGETLSQRLARGPLPWREVAEFGAQVARGVEALHKIGVIHRDLKPDNIMIAIGADRAIAKLLDLGLASVGTPFHEAQDALFTSQVTQRHKTQIGVRVGTPAYLPPEAGLCEAEPRLDVYSLGVMLYQLCTQALPEDTGVRPIQALCPDSDAPEDLSRLLRAALEPDVVDRLPSADHLRRGLEAILTAHPREPQLKHLFGGSFDLLEVLGVGASAIVYRASDRHLSRDVALKLLRVAKPSDDDMIRFHRAGKILSALHHPNIPRILHYGQDFITEQWFAVTELCAGSPATDFTRRDKHLRPNEVIALGRQLASAFAAAHAAGVIYRDLHVGNVLIARGEGGEEPHAWIFDFDQSQVSPAFYARLTERWATPPEKRMEPASETPLHRMDYAAPEVRAGAAFTVESDVFALGLLLYRLLTGQRPFDAYGSATEATPPSEVCPACSEGLEYLLLTMLNPEPSERPTLAMVQATLKDEQIDIEEAEREAKREAKRKAEEAAKRKAEEAATAEAEEAARHEAEEAEAKREAEEAAKHEAERAAVAPAATLASPSEGLSPAATADAAPTPTRPRRGSDRAASPGVGRAAVMAVVVMAAIVTAVVFNVQQPTSATLTTTPTLDGATTPTLDGAVIGGPVITKKKTERAAVVELAVPAAAGRSVAEAQQAAAPVPSAETKPKNLASSRSSKTRPALTSAAVSDIMQRAAANLRACKGVALGWAVFAVRVQNGRGTLEALGLGEPSACARQAVANLKFPSGTGEFRGSLRL